MAGDWIKLELTTPEKPEVFELAGMLKIHPDEVVGKLIRVWSWFDQHTENGNANVTVLSLLDSKTGGISFCDAMEKVGWLIREGDRVLLPKFDRHNGETSKRRGLTARRVAKHRTKSNAECNAIPVTIPLPEKRREEKRRIKNTPLPPKGDELFSYLFPENLTSDKFIEAWKDWIGHQKEKKKKLTERAAKMQLNKLSEMKNEDRAIATIKNSIEKNYSGLYEPSDYGVKQTHSAQRLPLAEGEW